MCLIYNNMNYTSSTGFVIKPLVELRARERAARAAAPPRLTATAPQQSIHKSKLSRLIRDRPASAVNS